MVKKQAIKLFEDRKVRTVWDDVEEKWYFSIVDVCGVLTDSPNPRNYWKVQKHRLVKEGNETVTNCNQLKLRVTRGQARCDMSLPLPPLEEQKRIVNAVERWFTLIDELESNEGDLLQAIDKAKSKILDLAIHGKLVPQDPNDEPAIELLKRINPKFKPCDETPWDLPNNWHWTTIGSIFNHNTGKALNKSDSQEGLLLPYITTSID